MSACSEKKGPGSSDWSGQGFGDATDIGTVTQLTDDYRSIYPVFGPGDTIVYYRRLLLTDAQDTFAYYPDELIKPYGKHISTGRLYTLSKASEFPSAREIDPVRLPHAFGKKPVFAVASPDSASYAFETVEGVNQVHTLFLVEGDSLRQISAGSVSCFLDRFSSTGRYLTAICGKVPTWILIFDLVDGGVYRIPHDGTYIDYLTSFSSDDRMMLFIRSNNAYRYGRDFFGNIDIFKFDGTRRIRKK
ncbi:MAG: hypothetical protein A2W25_01535 [candidate division Zixibacteria bacterium RBG_16_53_22]|nr:MAG: hypothetical protein A2W25_01535 [candidate division Zixibacteria bacterium RBG_16_53_22]